MRIVAGRYLHFKGREYEVIGTARHSETLEEFVVYKALYGKGDMWIRPKYMFSEKVTFKGKVVSRFRRVREGQITRAKQPSEPHKGI